MNIEPLPDALAKALGRIVADVQREAFKELERQAAESRAIMAELRAENLALSSELKAQADGEIARVRDALAMVKDGKDGRDGEPGPQGPQGEQGLPGLDGKDGIQGERGERGEKGEQGESGPHGEQGPSGVDGKDADPELIAALIDEKLAAAVAALPPPERGEKGDPGERGEKGDLGTAGPQGERGEPGADGERGEPGAPGERGQMGEKGDPGANGRDGKDAADIAGAFRTHDGKCVVTLTDGRVLDLGVIQGKDGAPGRDGADGKDGRDGLSIEDLSAEFDGERTLMLRFARGEVVKEIPVHLPIPIDRGIFKEGNGYLLGDGVTYGGSFWIAQKDAPEGKPDAGNGSWRLSVKHGRDGRDGKHGEKGERGPQGPAGRDFTIGKG